MRTEHKSPKIPYPRRMDSQAINDMTEGRLNRMSKLEFWVMAPILIITGTGFIIYEMIRNKYNEDSKRIRT